MILSKGDLINYHYPSHPEAYAGGYLSHSVRIPIGVMELCIIQEMDAESGIIQRQALFIEHALLEMLMFKKQPRNHFTGGFIKRISIAQFKRALS